MTTDNQDENKAIEGVNPKYGFQFLREFVQNSGVFPLTNLFLEMIKDGVDKFFHSFDPYVILSAALLQTYFVLKWRRMASLKRFSSYLVGPFAYSVFEVFIEGKAFFASLNHQIYWLFSVVIGLIALSKRKQNEKFLYSVQIFEGIVKTMTPFLMYLIFEILEKDNFSVALGDFFDDEGHIFIFAIGITLGINAGLSNITSDHYLKIIVKSANQMKQYSLWLLGKEMLSQLIRNPEAEPLARKERTIFFMDIRGFTNWSEKKEPEDVVQLLNLYYQVTEQILSSYEPVKLKFSADEVMIVFSDTSEAIRAGIEIQTALKQVFASENLGAGIGIHRGTLIEGLLGAMNVRFYDFIGDTVNTAKRIEGASLSGEILLSSELMKANSSFKFGALKEIRVKGKDQPLLLVSVLY